MGGCFGSATDRGINPNAVDLTHFEILKVVGRGGFGKVNAVENRNDKQLYAMKTIDKQRLLTSTNHLRTVWIERNVMALFYSNFLVHLHWALQDERNLYLIMHFMKGGDLRFYLTQHGKLTESMCRFYAAEILLALEEMNSLNIVYRDLKPENVLLDEFGHIRVSDFGLCKVLRKNQHYQARGESGTSGYMAPEVVSLQDYDTSQDVWSFGVIIYEFLHHSLPFATKSEVLEKHPKLSSSLSNECRSLLIGLLTKSRKSRLGCGPAKWDDIKNHEWFKGIDWNAAAEKALTPPFVPEADVANCSAIYDLEEQFFGDDGKTKVPIDAKQQEKFKGFDYHTEFVPSLIGKSQDEVVAYFDRVREQRKVDRLLEEGFEPSAWLEDSKFDSRDGASRRGNSVAGSRRGSHMNDHTHAVARSEDASGSGEARDSGMVKHNNEDSLLTVSKPEISVST